MKNESQLFETVLESGQILSSLHAACGSLEQLAASGLSARDGSASVDLIKTKQDIVRHVVDEILDHNRALFSRFLDLDCDAAVSSRGDSVPSTSRKNKES